jgi:hypothetical protein
VPWLLLDYPVSESIAPEKMWINIDGISPAELDNFHRKSVYIVNSAELINFFSRLHLDN